MKMQNLKSKIRSFGNLAIAFSGGVDSSFLVFLANDVLGQNALAITIRTPYMSNREITEAVEFAKMHGIRHEIISIETPREIEQNPQNRCYLCKKNLFSVFIKRANELGFSNFADGTNKDDFGEFRPGLKAKAELGVISPLQNLTKSEIRACLRELNLAISQKPSYACLLTRLPLEQKFSQIELDLVESCENLFILHGYENVRARFDGNSFKIELAKADMAKFLKDYKFKNLAKSKFENYEITPNLENFRGEII